MSRTWLTVAIVAAGCAAGPPAPVVIDTASDACAQCRMMVSDLHLAAQVVAPGEEPIVFDDIGCMRDYAAATGFRPGAVAYVADHRTGEWIAATRAVYTKATAVSTPMGSSIIAHTDTASRDADPAARGGVPAIIHIRVESR